MKYNNVYELVIDAKLPTTTVNKDNVDIQEAYPYTAADPCIDCPFCGKDNVYCHACPYDC